MELAKQQYTSIMEMPVKRFYDFIEWKIKFDEELNKIKKKNLEQI